MKQESFPSQFPTQSFQHIFDKYDIEKSEQKSLQREFESHGQFAIPIDKIVDSIPLQYFDSGKKTYYKDVPELIKLLDLEHIPSPFKDRICSFVKNHSGLFSTGPTDIGKIKDFQASIMLDKGRLDIAMRPQSVPYKIRNSDQKILDEYEEANTIERFEGESPVISNLICLKKPNTVDEYRCCLDSRLQNSMYPCKRLYSTSVTDVLRSVPVNARFYSVIDISSSYTSIELTKDSRRYFCFRSPDNVLFAMSRLPTGFCESAAFLKHALERILPSEGKAKSHIVQYVDDVILATNESLENHVEELLDLFLRLYNNGVKLQPKKCQILKDTVTFLGYGLQRGEFRISEEKVKAFTDFPMPKTRLKLRLYLNSASYFRNCIPKFAEYSSVLYQLITDSDPAKSNHTSFRLELVHINAFENLREHIKNSLSLCNPNYDDGFYLQFDASVSAVSYVLFQLDYSKITKEQEENMDFLKISNLENRSPYPIDLLFVDQKNFPVI